MRHLLLLHMQPAWVQASFSTLWAIVEQLVVTVISKLMPDWLLVPSISRIKNNLLLSSLRFVPAMCRKRRDLGKVQVVMLSAHALCQILVNHSSISARQPHIAYKHCCAAA